MSILLGFGYKMNVGKDTAGDYLVQSGLWEKHSFAGNLKACCMEVFSLSLEQVHNQGLKKAPFSKPLVLGADRVNAIFEWMSHYIGRRVPQDNAILSPLLGRSLYTPRDILQIVGTEIMRAHVPNYHAEVCFSGLSKIKNNVICDVRFPNEVDAVVGEGGFCVVIDRDVSVGRQNTLHASETALDSFTGWFTRIDNTKDGLLNLYLAVDNLIKELENGRQLG